MVVQVIWAKAEFENVASLQIPGDHEWVLDVEVGGELRKGVTVCAREILEVPNSRGTANLVIKVDKNIFATINIVDIPKVVKSSEITCSDEGLVPVLGLECRGCEIRGWSPTGFYQAKSALSDTVFPEVDLQTGEWCDFDAEGGQPVSILNFQCEVLNLKK